MYRIRYIMSPLFCVLTRLLFGNCSEPYLIKTNAKTGLLIVDGVITHDIAPHFLNLANTAQVRYWFVNAILNTKLAENTKGYYRWSVAEVQNIFPSCLPGAFSCPSGICYITKCISNYNIIVVKSEDYAQSTIKIYLS